MKNLNVTEMMEDAKKRHDLQAAKDAKEWGHLTPRKFKPAIKFYSRLGVFKASNVTFDPSTIYATSYRWWDMVKVIGGLVVFNDYTYSPTTSQHQSKVKSLMEQLGIKIDVTIEARKGLQSLDTAKTDYLSNIVALKAEIAKPKTRAGKNLERARTIKEIEAKIKLVDDLIRRESLAYSQAA